MVIFNFEKIKRASTEVNALKMQTPIVATQTKLELGYPNNHLVKFAFLQISKMLCVPLVVNYH